MGIPITGQSVNVEMTPNLQSYPFIAALTFVNRKIGFCKTQVPGMNWSDIGLAAIDTALWLLGKQPARL
jgi:hypothetical protein